MKTKALVIYHGNCVDGFSAAWCFWHKYKDDIEYLAGVYQNPPPDVSGRDVFLVDFSYKRAVVADMLSRAANVTLIDHHKSALDDLADLTGLRMYTDLHRSGATLAWDFLFPNQPRPVLLEHVEDQDLWRFSLPNTRELQANLLSYEYQFETWDKLMMASQEELTLMIADGRAILRKHYKDVAELVQVCKRQMQIGGYQVPVASLPYTLVSDAGHLMTQGQPFAACYWDTATGRTFGLRSDDTGLDVSKISQQYGGGGHPHAAGFSVPRDHPLAQA